MVSYTAESTVELLLTLNNSNDSSLGPGVYLDLDSLAFASNLPGWYAYDDSSFLVPYEKWLVSGSDAPDQVQPNVSYYIQFVAQPGQAAQDNAELTLTFTQAECWPLCASGVYCHIHSTRFGLAPIPGAIPWQAEPSRCYPWRQLFLPWTSQ